MRNRFNPAERILSFTDRYRFDENTVILFLASILGVAGGFGAVAFRTLIEALQTFSIGSSVNILEQVRQLPWYYTILLPSAGGLIVGPLVYYWGRETKGHGVPEVMEAVALRGGKIRMRVMFLKALVSAITIATGGSVGREGPIVQIGSSLGSTMGQLLKMSKERMRILVACGAAAGIAATFNAPIAGVLFAVEIILGNYAIQTLLPLILSSVMATIVGRWYFGNIPAFEIPIYRLNSPLEIGPYLVLGIASGIAAVIFIVVLYRIEDYAEKIPLKGWYKTPILLLTVGLMVVVFPEVYGVGYDSISQVLTGKTVWYFLLLLFPVKMLATSMTLAAGGSGGIFAPSLFLGAVFGAFFGAIMQMLFPSIVLEPGAYAVVGMSAMVAGTTHAPITAFLVIFEMTADYQLILPIMMCSIVASFVSSSLKRDSIYTLKLSRRGVDLSRGMEVSIMQMTKARDVMTQEMVVFDQRVHFNKILEKVVHANEFMYYVVDSDGTYRGSFSVHDLKEVIHEQILADLVVADDLIPYTSSPCVYLDSSLADCMKKLILHAFEELPVCVSAQNLKLVGKISRHDIINVYNREILKQDAVGLKFIQAKLPESAPTQSYVSLPPGIEIHVYTIDDHLVGKTLHELEVRQKYNVSVVSINRRNEHGVYEVVSAAPDLSLQKSDQLITIGEKNCHYNMQQSLSLHPWKH